MDFIMWIIGIISMIQLWRMINLAFTLGTRIAVASEATAMHVAALYNTLSPEAKARANAAIERIVAEATPAPKSNKRRVDATSTF